MDSIDHDMGLGLTLLFLDNSITKVDYFNDSVIEEIESYSKLSDGWDFGKGAPSSQATTLNAIIVYLQSKLEDFEVEPHPNEDGSITLIAFKGDHFLDIDVSENDILTLRYEIGRGSDYRVVWKNKKCHKSQLKSELLVIKSECKKAISSESSASKDATAPLKSALTNEKHLSRTTEASLFSAKTAPYTSVQGVYVSI